MVNSRPPPYFSSERNSSSLSLSTKRYGIFGIPWESASAFETSPAEAEAAEEVASTSALVDVEFPPPLLALFFALFLALFLAFALVLALFDLPVTLGALGALYALGAL